ncbi:MAG: hypothetical protein L0I76_29765 [Pseudonocardia sp.]|nr:hypothetical protein [Pseudonocardia sp.]
MSHRSTWRYRVVRQTLHGETLYGVHEAYDGGTSWTANPVAPVAESVTELRDVLAKMATAPEFDVIDDDARGAVVVGRPDEPFRVALARELHAADCGCADYGDPRTDEDDRYIRAVDAALAGARPAAAPPEGQSMRR